jgi:hypothetical protein
MNEIPFRSSQVQSFDGRINAGLAGKVSFDVSKAFAGAVSV